MLEIACFSPEAAYIAQSAGADRIELCANYAVGGTTPAFEDVFSVCDQLAVPVFVMIRPRSGDFVYSQVEFRRMEHSVLQFKRVVDGFVFGVLTPSNEVDEERNRSLVDMAAPKPCTFHRAMDETEDLEKSLEAIARCGFRNVLTSGGKKSATEGAETLKALVLKGREHNVEVIPGGGIRASNLVHVKEVTGANWFHSAAILDGDLPNRNEIEAIKSYLMT